MKDTPDHSREAADTKRRKEFATNESFCVDFIIWGELRHRHHYVSRDDSPGWWRVYEEWTGETWRSLNREPVVDVVVHSPQDSAGQGDE